MRSTFFLATATTALALVITGCGDDKAARDDDGGGASGGATGAGGAGGATVGTGGEGPCGADDAGPNELLGTAGDPAGGVFTMEEALEGLPAGDGPLRAIIRTELGDITCTLEPELVPNGVANFVGLARGRRPWMDGVSAGQWVKKRFYDGLIFHRIIDDFVAQGGDPLGTGYGGPGYQFDSEIVASLIHTPGTLAYANSGPDTNGSQFYITEVALPNLDGGYVVFGQCEPMATIQALTAVETSGAPNDKPLVDVHMTSIDITRCPL